LLSIVSSLKNKSLPDKLIVFGEIGLAGEIRPAPRGQERLKEAAKLGFSRALIPEANRPRQTIANMEIVAVRRVEEAFQKLRELE
jgi:DNA repair protein RadA/Sms